MKKKILFGLFVLLGVFNLVYAEEVNNDIDLTSGDLLISEGDKGLEKFNSVSDDDIEFNKKIFGSNAIFGDTVHDNGIVQGINTTFGNNVVYNGTSDYGFVFGNNVTVNGNIINDGAVFGNNVTFGKDAVIGRDISVFANKVVLSGTFERDLVVYASEVELNNVTIKGNAKIDASKIVVYSNTTVMGNLSYPSDIDEDRLIINSDSKITSMSSFASDVKEETTGDIVWDKVSSLLSLLIIFSVLYFLVPKLFDNLNRDLLKDFGAGLIVLIGLPIVCFFLFISVLGLPLAILLILFYIALIYLGTIFTGYLCGEVLFNKLNKKNVNKYLMGLTGIVIVFVLKLIPFIGMLVTFIVICISLGSLVFLFKRKK